MNRKYTIQESLKNGKSIFEVWSVLGEQFQIEARFYIEKEAQNFIASKRLGTPSTMIEAINNAFTIIGGVNGSQFCAKLISAHVRDFLAQAMSVEMMKAESDETLLALQRLMAVIDAQPIQNKLLIAERKVDQELESA